MKLHSNAMSVVRIDSDFSLSALYTTIWNHHSVLYTFYFFFIGKQMKHINNFKIHMRSHRGINDSESLTLNSLHLENRRKYLCPTCGRACTSQSNLAVHTRRHTGTMTNFCKICGKGYPRSTDLTIHMR